jgi:hypothetical protein
VKLLGEEGAKLWEMTPIPQLHGFTIKDMIQYGLYIKVNVWFNTLTDEDILEISKGEPLCLS